MAASRIRLDLNSPEFQNVFFRLAAADLKQVVVSLGRLRELDWNTLDRHTGYQWEHISHLKGSADAKGLVSLHPDHDSPYDQ